MHGKNRLYTPYWEKRSVWYITREIHKFYALRVTFSLFSCFSKILQWAMNPLVPQFPPMDKDQGTLFKRFSFSVGITTSVTKVKALVKRKRRDAEVSSSKNTYKCTYSWWNIKRKFKSFLACRSHIHGLKIYIRRRDLSFP